MSMPTRTRMGRPKRRPQTGPREINVTVPFSYLIVSFSSCPSITPAIVSELEYESQEARKNRKNSNSSSLPQVSSRPPPSKDRHQQQQQQQQPHHRQRPGEGQRYPDGKPFVRGNATDYDADDVYYYYDDADDDVETKDGGEDGGASEAGGREPGRPQCKQIDERGGGRS